MFKIVIVFACVGQIFSFEGKYEHQQGDTRADKIAKCRLFCSASPEDYCRKNPDRASCILKYVKFCFTTCLRLEASENSPAIQSINNDCDLKCNTEYYQKCGRNGRGKCKMFSTKRCTPDCKNTGDNGTKKRKCKTVCSGLRKKCQNGKCINVSTQCKLICWRCAEGEQNLIYSCKIILKLIIFILVFFLHLSSNLYLFREVTNS